MANMGKHGSGRPRLEFEAPYTLLLTDRIVIIKTARYREYTLRAREKFSTAADAASIQRPSPAPTPPGCGC